MNERIKELAVEANDQTGNNFDLNYKELNTFLEKFAELIVQECADLFEVEWGSSMLQGTTAAHYLKQHFGVEE